MATHSSILAQRIPWTEGPGGSPWGRKESDMTEQQTTHTKQKGQLGMEGHRLQVCESFCFQESSVSSHHSLFEWCIA